MEGGNISVIIIEADKDSRELLKSTLADIDDVEVLAETESLLYGYEMVRQNQPKLVFIDLRQDIGQVLSIIERIATYHQETMIFASGENLTLDTLKACMQAGVREFLARPLTAEEIIGDIDRHRGQLLADREAGDLTGRLITVFSNKGGLGKTTVAVNLAVALSEVTDKTVALIDLNLQLGDVTTFLDIEPKQTIVDIARNLARVDKAYLESSLALYETDKAKVFVLADPVQVEEGEEVTANQINSILTILKASFDYVVVDTTTSFDAKTLTALDLADHILLTSIINLPCIRSTQRVLMLFDRLGYAREKIKLLINRYMPNEEITAEDVEETLEHPIFWKTPNNYMTVMSAINRGAPIPTVNDESPIWESFLGLASRLAGLIRPKKKKAEDNSQQTGLKLGLLSKILPTKTTKDA